MGRYDYRCNTCDETREYEHPMAETLDHHECDVCGQDLLHRQYSPNAVVFKGTGWAGKKPDFKPKGNGID